MIVSDSRKWSEEARFALKRSCQFQVGVSDVENRARVSGIQA